MRLTLLTLFVAPFVHGVVAAAVNSNNAGLDGLAKRQEQCYTFNEPCSLAYENGLCCPGLLCCVDTTGFSYCEVTGDICY
ncbi:hypothetical protein BKA82DRAFT_1004420 [Pisolithus tinctorius]|nr:hypothetical protein BKA82DRAFT_1004420 [Pisolithus tinctorius]